MATNGALASVSRLRASFVLFVFFLISSSDLCFLFRFLGWICRFVRFVSLPMDFTGFFQTGVDGFYFFISGFIGFHRVLPSFT